MNLHPDVETFLAEVPALGLPPSSGGSVEQMRERHRRLSLHYAGEPPAIAVETPAACPVPARLYRQSDKWLVWFHGGRFVTGGLDTHDALCRYVAADSGWSVLSVDYRLAPENPFPAALDDALAAWSWAAGQTPAAAVGGDSAGAHLALLAAVESHARPAGCVLIYPMIDATCSQPSHETYQTGPGVSSADIRAGYDLWLPPAADRGHPRVSPLFTDFPKKLPPFYILLAEHDPLRDEGLQCAARLHQAGARVHASLFAGLIHGFLNYPARFRHAHKASREIAAFLAAH